MNNDDVMISNRRLLLLSSLLDGSGVNSEQSVALGITETWLAGTLALNTVFSFLYYNTNFQL